MRSLCLSLIALATTGLNRLHVTMNSRQSEWFMNHNGSSRFLPVVIPNNGAFKSVIFRWTGYCSRDFDTSSVLLYLVCYSAYGHEGWALDGTATGCA